MFDVGAKARLKNAHPLLQQLMNAAETLYPFTIMDSQRGRVAQENAYKHGWTKVHFGQSAHNWSPALALDLAPTPILWDNTKANFDRWRVLQITVILPIARHQSIPIRQGIDWNMNGNLNDDGWDDLPHVELHPWREFAKKAKLFQG